jgi:hypothetical protein
MRREREIPGEGIFRAHVTKNRYNSLKYHYMKLKREKSYDLCAGGAYSS